MARANRVGGGAREGGIFHVTHRCHNREFLLRFACDRDGYREKLREHVRKYEVWLLDYCVTSNHVHLLLGMSELEDVRRKLEASLAERIGRDQMKREPCWTESLAVGSAGFVEKIKPLILSRLDTEIIEQGEERWVLQEAATAYG